MLDIFPESLFAILMLTGEKESLTELYEPFEDTDILLFWEVFPGDVDGWVYDLHDESCVIFIPVHDVTVIEMKVLIDTYITI